MGEQQGRMVEDGAPAAGPRDKPQEARLTDAAQEDRSFEAAPIDGGEEREAGDSSEGWLQEGEPGSRRGGEDALTTDAAAPHQKQP